MHRAFAKLDRNGNGLIELSDIKDTYNARMHPDVKSGKRTEDDVLMEFLETFEMHHNILMGKPADHTVTPEEFEEYYANVSASIDDDEYFALMMKNAWKLDEAAKVHPRGWKAEEEMKAPTASPPKFAPPRSPPKKAIANASSIDNTLQLGAQLYNQMQATRQEQGKPASLDQALESFRKKLASRGTRGILGMGRQFRVRLSSTQ